MIIPYKKILLLVIAIGGIAASVWIAGIFGIFNRNAAVNNTVGDSVNGLVARGDLFDGVITNMSDIPNVKLGVKFLGTGVYDKNCVKVGVAPETGNPLVNCHAGIKTEYGVIDFNHVHDYYKKPCIIEEDEVMVEVLDLQGNAKVQRISEIPKKAVQEKGEMSN